MIMDKWFKKLAFFGSLTVDGKDFLELMYREDWEDLVEVALFLTDLDKKSNRGASLSVDKRSCDTV